MFPVTCGDVANAPPAGRTCANPVKKLAAAGLKPIFPVIADVGTFEVADLARITYVPAVPSTTGAGPWPEPPLPVPLPGVVGDKSMGAVVSSPHPAANTTRRAALKHIPRET